jgi:hypothetical protein
LKKNLLQYPTKSRLKAIQKRLGEVDKLIKNSIQTEREQLESKAIYKVKDDPKHFFNYAKGRTKIKDCIGPLIQSDGSLTSSTSEVTNTLQSQYCSAFSIPMMGSKILDPTTFFNHEPRLNTEEKPSLSNINISKAKVHEALLTLKVNSAPGEDKIPSILLRNCAEALAGPLSIYYRKSMDAGIIPQSLKSAVITPIYKGGDKEAPKNYRPIALTSVLSKVMEKVVVKQLSDYLESEGLMSDRQYGFRR